MATDNLKDGQFLLGLSVGTGYTIGQAEFAMLQGAKKRRDSDPNKVSMDPANFNIVQFGDLSEKLRTEGIKNLSEIEAQRPKYSDRVESYKTLLNYLQGDPDRVEMHRRLNTVDPTTELSNRLGYYLASEGRDQLALPEGYKRLFIFADCDHMKHWNEVSKGSYAETTRHICAIGQGIQASTRQEEEEEEEEEDTKHERRATDVSESKLRDLVIATRVHGETGDEFLLDVFCPPDQIIPIAQRIIATAYQKQLDLYK